MNRLILAIFFLQAVSYLVAANDDAEVEIHPENEEDLKLLFEEFKAKHNKTYHPDHEKKHFQTFKNHAKAITEHNRAFKNGSVTWHQKLNSHSDKTPEEFAQWLNKGLNKTTKDSDIQQDFSHLKRASLPASVDWRSQIPPIKDQQQCGSCWSFSSVVTVEHQLYKLGGSVISLSEEQLADCTYPRNGCDGGSPSYALTKLALGIETESLYPYGYYPNETTATTGTCKFDKAKSVAAVTTVTQLSPGSETSIQNALANYGVVSICVDASNFQHYAGGIYNDQKCSKTKLNHAVALVGYNITGNYYILRNSWNTWWGEKGYMRIAMGSNTCGLAQVGVYPAVKKP